MRPSICFAAMFAASLAVAGGKAAADEIAAVNIAMPYLQVLTVDSPISPTEGYIGQLVLTTSTGSVLDAWCIDLFHDGHLGHQNSIYSVEPITTDNNGTALSAVQISEIAGLVAHGNDLLTDGGSSSVLDQESAAVQLAIWSVEYPSFSYSGGDSGLADLTSQLVSDAAAGDFSGSAYELFGLQGQQSYAVEVPEPSSLVLFAPALAALFAPRRRAAVARPRTGFRPA